MKKYLEGFTKKDNDVFTWGDYRAIRTWSGVISMIFLVWYWWFVFQDDIKAFFKKLKKKDEMDF